jgi:hypothetical protein
MKHWTLVRLVHSTQISRCNPEPGRTVTHKTSLGMRFFGRKSLLFCRHFRSPGSLQNNWTQRRDAVSCEVCCPWLRDSLRWQYCSLVWEELKTREAGANICISVTGCHTAMGDLVRVANLSNSFLAYFPYSEKIKVRLYHLAVCVCVCICISHYQLSNAWTNLSETWYVYHDTCAHLKGVVYKSLPTICVSVTRRSTAQEIQEA